MEPNELTATIGALVCGRFRACQKRRGVQNALE